MSAAHDIAGNPLVGPLVAQAVRDALTATSVSAAALACLWAVFSGGGRVWKRGRGAR